MKNLYIIILFIILSGCSDNPTSISTKLSPPRYSWTVDTLPGFGYEIVPFDTNSYFILTYADLLNKNANGIQTPYSLDFLGTSMDGDGESNLMIGGAIEYSSEDYFPILKKFNNGALTEIYRGSTHSDYYYFSCVNLIDNIFWCGTTKGEIVSYNNGVVNYFVTDTTYGLVTISKDRNNNINAVMVKALPDSIGSLTGTSYKIYTYRSNIWQLTYQKDSFVGGTKIYAGVRDRIFALINDYETFGTYDISGGIFTRILDENTTGVYCSYAGGKSMNDLIIYGKDVNSTSNYGNIFHWNGVSASEEKISNFSFDHKDIVKMVNRYDKNYIMFQNHYLSTFYLIRSTKLK